jgi:hypothetical protein
MKKIQQRAKPVPIGAFADAFCKLKMCAAEDFKITVGSDNCTAFIYYKDKVYQVNPMDGLYEELKSMFDDPDTAQYIDLDILIEATPGILSSPQFLIKLVQSLNSEKGRSLLNIALMISLFAPKKKEETFWHALWPLDETGLLLGKAVLTAAKTYGLDVLAGKIFQLQIRDGLRVYNEKQRGIFEKVILNEDAQNDRVYFIYTISENNVIC